MIMDTLRTVKYLIFGLCAIILEFAGASGCEVEIRKPYHPMYVQTGSRMELECTATRCSSDERIHLQWDRQTQESKWAKQGIVPSFENGWITRNLYEEPSGNVESTLIREQVTVDDRGWYFCRDEKDDNSFSIWVTALKIESTSDITLQGAVSEEDVVLTCSISGLHTNLPHIEYIWYWKHLEILNTTDRYTLLPPSHGNSSLVIHKPKKRDGGLYRCAYFFRTNLGPVNFSQPINVDTSTLTVSGSPSIHGILTVYLPLVLVWLLQPVNQ